MLVMPALDPNIHRKSEKPGESPAVGSELDFIYEIFTYMCT